MTTQNYLQSQIEVDEEAGVDEAEVKAIKRLLARFPALARDYAGKHDSTETKRTLEAFFAIAKDVFQLDPDIAEALQANIHSALQNGILQVAGPPATQNGNQAALGAGPSQAPHPSQATPDAVLVRSYRNILANAGVAVPSTFTPEDLPRLEDAVRVAHRELEDRVRSAEQAGPATGQVATAEVIKKIEAEADKVTNAETKLNEASGFGPKREAKKALEAAEHSFTVAIKAYGESLSR
jgi:hypothetical protein